MIIKMNHPIIGESKMIGAPTKFSSTQVSYRQPAPLFGQHTEEILNELGYDITKISRLLDKEVIVNYNA